MSGIVTAVVATTAVAGGVQAYGAHQAGKASEKGAEVSADAQMAQLQYLKETNALPQELKEEALTKLGDISRDPQEQQKLIEQAKASPMYQQMVGNRAVGEEAVMRHASQTGGLRSGNVQSALYDYNVGLENQALTQAYGQQMSGLQRLAGLPTSESEIGRTMANIGETRAQGVIGKAQAYQQGLQGISNTLLQGAGLGIRAGMI